MKNWLAKNVNWIFLGVGGICVNVALDQAFDISFGWWGFLFWLGAGFIIGAAISEAKH